MRLMCCCILSLVVMATGFPQGTMDNFQDPLNIDTPDDQDEGANVNPQGNPQTGSSYFIPTEADSSISSSSEEEGSDTDMGSIVPVGSVPSGTAGQGGSPVVGAGAAGNKATGVQGGGAQGGGQGGGNAGSTDQNSGEQKPGGALQDDPSFLSKIQTNGNTQLHTGSAGQAVGIAIGVLALVSVSTIGIIFAIRKKRDGFMRFYTQASNEL
ncbi:uncharacterized protein [Asterias amurensis]|uniref:uncharacterized protein n=1 Tax=Asterias amurensis TaxID=7602 RepID=UPI003AB6CD23